jgi:hypothetical protein
MFTWRVRDPFGSFGVSCVKLPAAAAFPTDDRLLQRLEESRRALPPNSVKALRRRRALESYVTPSARHDGGRLKLEAGVPPDVESYALRESGWTLPQKVHIEDVYARSRVAVGQR